MARVSAGTTSDDPGRPGKVRTNVPPGGSNVRRLVKVLSYQDEVPVMGNADERIAQIASHQRGRVATRQLTAAGISTSAIGRRAHDGRLFGIHRGVFATGHPGSIELGDETAALLAAGERAALSGLTAGRVWGLLTAPSDPDEVIHVVSPTERRSHLPQVLVHHSTLLLPADIRIHRGLPLLSPARTLLDLAEQATVRRTELALDRGLVDRLLRLDELDAVIRRAPTRHGAKVLAEIIAGAGSTTVTRSEAEERVLDLIREAELPVPRVNARLHGYEVDFYWPSQHLVLEVDGYRFHHTRRAFEHDRRKDAILQAAGIAAMRVTWRQITREPLGFVTRLAQALVLGAGAGAVLG